MGAERRDGHARLIQGHAFAGPARARHRAAGRAGSHARRRSCGRRACRRRGPPWSSAREPSPARGTRRPDPPAPGPPHAHRVVPRARRAATIPVRSDTNRSVPSRRHAGWPTASSGPPATRHGAPAARQGVRVGIRARRPGNGKDDDRRRVPRHVGVIPDHDGHPGAARVDPRGPEEIVPFEQRGLPGLGAAGRQRDDAAHRAWHARAVDLADGQDPVTVGRGGEPTVVVDLSFRRGDGEGPRRPQAGPSRHWPGRRRTRPAARSGRHRRRRRPTAGARGTRRRRRTRGPGCGCSPPRANGRSARPRRPAPARRDPTRRGATRASRGHRRRSRARRARPWRERRRPARAARPSARILQS